MTVRVDAVYLGELGCRAIHGPSGAELLTDAPVDNQGKGEQFSPTDLVSTALGTCILTLIGMVGDRHDLPVRGTSVRVLKHMSEDLPRRIVRLEVEVLWPQELSEEEKPKLEKAAQTCPVHATLLDSIQIDLRFAAQGEAAES